MLSPGPSAPPCLRVSVVNKFRKEVAPMLKHITITTLAVLLALCGCEKSETTSSTTQPVADGGGGRRKIVIGFVAKSQSNQVFQAAHAGARDAARDLGSKYNADVSVDIRTPTDEDATKQAEAIE